MDLAATPGFRRSRERHAHRQACLGRRRPQALFPRLPKPDEEGLRVRLSLACVREHARRLARKPSALPACQPSLSVRGACTLARANPQLSGQWTLPRSRQSRVIGNSDFPDPGQIRIWGESRTFPPAQIGAAPAGPAGVEIGGQPGARGISCRDSAPSRARRDLGREYRDCQWARRRGQAHGTSQMPGLRLLAA
jgi:hypothetical protein